MSVLLCHGKWENRTSLRFPPIFYRMLVEIGQMPYNDHGTMGIASVGNRGDSDDLRRAAHERAPPKT